jgi:hypothetical protein
MGAEYVQLVNVGFVAAMIYPYKDPGALTESINVLVDHV